jgi:hypothetical protein
MLAVLALAGIVAGASVEAEACRMVAESLADNAIECPLFPHEVVSGDFQGVKDPAVVMIAPMKPADGRVLIIAVVAEPGNPHWRALGEWKGAVPKKLDLLPAGEYELLSESGSPSSKTMRCGHAVLMATFSDGSQKVLLSDGKSWRAIKHTPVRKPAQT